MNNPYEELNLSKDATRDQIKKAYRNLSKLHHPDKKGNSDKFRDINKAYEILQDEEKRKYFDETGLLPDGTPTIVLWGQRVNYKDNILYIAEISTLMTIAYYIIHKYPHFGEDELKIVIQNLCNKRFINEGDINVTMNINKLNKIEVTLGRRFYPKFIKYSYTVEQWEKLYEELTKIFIK